MFQYLLLISIFISVSYVNCQTANTTTIGGAVVKIVTNETATNVTRLLVTEFVSGIGKALQQLLTSQSAVNRQSVDFNSTVRHGNSSSRVEGEKLREEINKRVNQLQTLIGTAIQVSKDRRDVMTRRVLEQINGRLEGAKDRADKILSEPHNSEIAVRTLRTINTGISSLSTFANTVLGRVNVSINVNLKPNGQQPVNRNTTANSPAMRS